jgi:hypothetical protein
MAEAQPATRPSPGTHASHSQPDEMLTCTGINRRRPRKSRCAPRTPLADNQQPMARTPKRNCYATALGLLAAAVLIAGCGTAHPRQLSNAALREAQTFPYYRLYWAGPSFIGTPLAAVDGMKSYSTAIGDSVYYGDCVSGKGLLGGGGSCLLPLQVTTVIYRLHSNGALGPQRNALLRGVPATIYDEERSIELYSGHLAIDVFSDTLAHALLAVEQLRPLNASGSANSALPAPVYCPGLSGSLSPQLRATMSSLPGHPCQKAQAALAAGEHSAPSSQRPRERQSPARRSLGAG